MTPFGRLAAALTAALLMWAPAGWKLFHGKLDILLAGVSLVIALVISYIGTGVVSNLINNYGAQQRRALQRARQVQAEIEMMERKRRREDKSANG